MLTGCHGRRSSSSGRRRRCSLLPSPRKPGGWGGGDPLGWIRGRAAQGAAGTATLRTCTRTCSPGGLDAPASEPDHGDGDDRSVGYGDGGGPASREQGRASWQAGRCSLQSPAQWPASQLTSERPELRRSHNLLVLNSQTLKLSHNHNNKRPLTPKSMPPASDEHAKLKT